MLAATHRHKMKHETAYANNAESWPIQPNSRCGLEIPQRDLGIFLLARSDGLGCSAATRRTLFAPAGAATFSVLLRLQIPSIVPLILTFVFFFFFAHSYLLLVSGNTKQ